MVWWLLVALVFGYLPAGVLFVRLAIAPTRHLTQLDTFGAVVLWPILLSCMLGFELADLIGRMAGGRR